MPNVAPAELTDNKVEPSTTFSCCVVAEVKPLNTPVVGFIKATTEANSSFNNSKLLLITGLDDDTESVPKISAMFAVFRLFYF